MKKDLIFRPLYALVDLGITTAELFRNAKKAGKHNLVVEGQAAWSLYNIMQFAAHRAPNTSSPVDKFTLWETPDRYDDNLLLIIDLVLHQSRWDAYLGGDTLARIKLRNGIKPGSTANFLNVVERLQLLMQQPAIGSRNQQCMFYVLAYRLFPGHCAVNGDRARLCERLQHFNLKHFLEWGRNSGVYFLKDFNFDVRADQRIAVEGISDTDLFQRLSKIVQVLEPHLGTIPHFSAAQAPIFSILAYRLKDHPQARVWCELLKNIDLQKILRFRSTD